LFGGLTKLGLDLSNQKTRRMRQSRQQQVADPLVIEGMQMPADEGWTFYPPPPK
jgi:hypothetical protein